MVLLTVGPTFDQAKKKKDKQNFRELKKIDWRKDPMNELFEQSYISTSTYPKRTMKTEKELLSIHMRSKLNE